MSSSTSAYSTGASHSSHFLHQNQPAYFNQQMQQQSTTGNIDGIGSFASLRIDTSSPSSGYQQDMKNTLWMGDLEPWMDENFVKQLWLSFGEHVNVKIIRDKFSGMNAGYCFVEFVSYECAFKILQTFNGHPIPGTSNKAFRLNWASGGGINDKKDQGPEFSIFVGDLGPEVDDPMLFSIFHDKYSSCKTAKVVTDAMTGLSRGYGFVRFSDEMEQQRSMSEMQGRYCGSRPMRISVATPKNRFASVTNWNAVYGVASLIQQHQQNVNGNQFHPNASANPQQQLQLGSSSSGFPGMSNLMTGGIGGQILSAAADPNNTTVFVGGLTNTLVAEEELATYFAPFGPITYVKIPPGKGCGFVSYVHRQSAEQAISQLNGCVISGNRVRLSWGRNNSATGLNSTSLTASPTLSSGAPVVGANWKSSTPINGSSSSSSGLNFPVNFRASSTTPTGTSSSPTTPTYDQGSLPNLSYASSTGASVSGGMSSATATKPLMSSGSNQSSSTSGTGLKPNTSSFSSQLSSPIFQGSRSLFALGDTTPVDNDSFVNWKCDSPFEPISRPTSAFSSFNSSTSIPSAINSNSVTPVPYSGQGGTQGGSSLRPGIQAASSSSASSASSGSSPQSNITSSAFGLSNNNSGTANLNGNGMQSLKSTLRFSSAPSSPDRNPSRQQHHYPLHLGITGSSSSGIVFPGVGTSGTSSGSLRSPYGNSGSSFFD